MWITERDDLLRMTDEALAAKCSWDFHRTTGNGGQKKNKTSSAVRVIHTASGISAVCDSERSQKINRKGALHKLRLAIALAYREKFDTSVNTVCGGTVPALSSPNYPLFAAYTLDALADAEWEPEAACALLGWSKSRLYKVLGRDSALGAEVNRERQKRSKSFLHFCS